jgi:ABC-2 type transport system permease protein
MQMARHYWSVGEAVTGALYVLCGAIFPIDRLPEPLLTIARLLPLTYWLEAIRRALLGHTVSEGISPILSSISDEGLLLILLAVTVSFGVASIYFFRWSEHQAREKGLFDMTTQY